VPRLESSSSGCKTKVAGAAGKATLLRTVPVKVYVSVVSTSTIKINLAFMNDLDIVAVRIEHPCRIIAGIVFGPSLR
jgi:hypothetical protein